MQWWPTNGPTKLINMDIYTNQQKVPLQNATSKHVQRELLISTLTPSDTQSFTTKSLWRCPVWKICGHRTGAENKKKKNAIWTELEKQDVDRAGNFSCPEKHGPINYLLLTRELCRKHTTVDGKSCTNCARLKKKRKAGMKEQQQKIFVSGHLTDPIFFYLTLNFF